MDDSNERPDPPQDGISESGPSAAAPEGGQAGSEGPAENPLSAKESHRIPGRFQPGVMPPVGRQWKPGESGNPLGGSRAARLTKKLIEALDKNDGEMADALIRVALREALKGKYQFWEHIYGRVEGTLAQRLAVDDGRLTIILGGTREPAPAAEGWARSSVGDKRKLVEEVPNGK